MLIVVLAVGTTIISCDKPHRRPFDWCIYHDGRCQYKDKTKDRYMENGDWVLTAPERLAIESYLIILEEQLQELQGK